jgi:hypothetical protein
MAKNSSSVMENTPQVVEAPAVVTKNRTVTFHAFATKELSTRRSYKIEGHAGCLVIERSLFLTATLHHPRCSPLSTVKVGGIRRGGWQSAFTAAKARRVCHSSEGFTRAAQGSGLMLLAVFTGHLKSAAPHYLLA